MNAPLPPSHGPVERLFSVADFMALAASGAFENDGKVELIDGRLVMAPADGTLHAFGQSGVHLALTRLLLADAERERLLRVVATPTIEISPIRALIPDTALVALDALRQAPRLLTPADVELAVETADSSLRYDDGHKKAMWAEAGLRELWIVRLSHADVRICRGAQADGAWLEERLLTAGDVIAPLFAPHEPIAVTALLGEV